MTKFFHSPIGLFLAKVTAITSLLLAAVFMQRMADFSARCYSSQLVDRLVLFSERKEVPHCRRGLTDFAAVDRFTPNTDQWGRWLSALDRLQDLWPQPTHNLAIVVVNEEPFLYVHEQNRLIIGGGWATSRRLWNNLVASAWLAPSTPGMMNLEREILSEFLVSVTEGRHELIGLNQVTVPDDEIQWSNVAQTTQDYCQSVWRRPEELTHCTVENGENFRPLLSRGLWLIYRQADWTHRRKLLYWLTDVVAKNQESLLVAKPTTDEDSVEWIQSELLRWSEKANLSQNAFFIKNLWLRLGLLQAETPFVVIESSIPDSLVLNSETPLLFQDQGQSQWLGSIGRNMAPTVMRKPQHMVKVSCQKPSLDQLQNSASGTVLIVMACDPNRVLGWDLLAQQQIKLFISKNPGLPMMWLSVSGLRRTLNKKSLASVPLSLKYLRRLSHWKEDLWDKSSQAFVPRAAVDLVLSHRASQELL